MRAFLRDQDWAWSRSALVAGLIGVAAVFVIPAVLGDGPWVYAFGALGLVVAAAVGFLLPGWWIFLLLVTWLVGAALPARFGHPHLTIVWAVAHVSVIALLPHTGRGATATRKMNAYRKAH